MSSKPQPKGFLARHGVKIGVVLALIALGWVAHILSQNKPSNKRQISEVTLLAPPPPPPPPPKTPPPPKKMVEQTPVDKPEPKPDAPKSPPIGPAVTGHGNGPAVGGGGTGGEGGGGSRWGWYASGVQSSIKSALQENAMTHHASMGVQAHIWADFTGRITRAKLVGSTGNPALDETIQNQVLTGLVLPGPPPPGMPMPINIRISAH